MEYWGSKTPARQHSSTPGSSIFDGIRLPEPVASGKAWRHFSAATFETQPPPLFGCQFFLLQPVSIANHGYAFDPTAWRHGLSR